MGEVDSVDAYAARLAAAVGPDGHLPLDLDGMLGWDTFPLQMTGAVVRQLEPPPTAEPERMGEHGPLGCQLGRCRTEPDPAWPLLWRNARWQLKAAAPSGVPLVVILEPLDHLDLTDLDDDLAAELGRLTVAVTRAVEALPSVGRCHSMRVGDGARHLHAWFFARPARMPQLRGSFLLLWDDLLPPIPVEVRDAHAAFVTDRLLESVGGERLHG